MGHSAVLCIGWQPGMVHLTEGGGISAAAPRTHLNTLLHTHIHSGMALLPIPHCRPLLVASSICHITNTKHCMYVGASFCGQ